MEVLELKKLILDNKLPNNLILTGDEALLDIYLNQIYDRFTILKCNSVKDYLIKKANKFKVEKENSFYLVYEDDNFRTNSDLWVKELTNIILVYKKLDKKDKFYKAFEQNIVWFPALTDDQLKGLINNRVTLSENKIDWLINNCNHNYFKCLNEVNKLQVFDKKSHNDLFDLFKETNVFSQSYVFQPYAFVNAVSDRNKKEALKILLDLPKDEPIGQLSLCYANLRNQLLVQGGNQTAEQLGINPKVYYVLSKKRNYSIEELCRALLGISDLITKIKTGLIDQVVAINLFVMRYM